MATLDDYRETPPAPPIKTFIRRHSGVTRITHWINVLCFSQLLMSGLQIFNAHPSLYWGQYGADAEPSWLSIEAVGEGDDMRGICCLQLESLAIAVEQQAIDGSYTEAELVPNLQARLSPHLGNERTIASRIGIRV